MASGRKLKIKKNGTTLISVQEKSVTMMLESGDLTNDDDAGWQRQDDDVAKKGIDLSFSGAVQDYALRTEINNIMTGGGSMNLTDYSLEFPDGATWTGDWTLGSVGYEGSTGDVLKFNGELKSSGPMTFTAGP